MKKGRTKPELAAVVLQEAEEKFLEKTVQSPETKETLSPEKMEKTLHELRARLNELESQNEKLRRTQNGSESEPEMASMRESAERYRALFDHASEGMIMMSVEGGKLEVNESFARMHGYSPEEMAQMRLSDLDTPETAKMAPERLRRMLAGETLTFEVEHFQKNGKRFPLSVICSVVQLDGQLFFLGFHRDITERKRAEEEKVRLEAQLLQAQKMEMVGRLAGGVSHDFNNMLGVILGFAEIALTQVDPSQSIHGNLKEIRKAASRSAHLTRQLLAFARKQTIAPTVLDLNETVREMLNILRGLVGEDIHLSWKPASQLWRVKVDPSQVDQVLANLCANSRDAISGVGKMIIETGNQTLHEEYCAAHPGYFPGDYVFLSVRDDGCGMNGDVLAHLFEPFFTTKEVGKGTGLGLATVYGIVKQNGGFIIVESEPGKGTTFKVYLPRFEPRNEPKLKQMPLLHDKRGNETILLVEDEQAILKLTREVLELEGYAVLAASKPSDAIRLAKKHGGKVHLLMTDLIMPEMNGRDLAKNLLEFFPNLECLFMSGYAAEVVANHGILDDGVHFIQKPFLIQELVSKVRAALDGKIAGSGPPDVG